MHDRRPGGKELEASLTVLHQSIFLVSLIHANGVELLLKQGLECVHPDDEMLEMLPMRKSFKEANTNPAVDEQLVQRNAG